MRSQILRGTILFAWLPCWFAAEQPLQAQNIRVPNGNQLLDDGGRVAWSSKNIIAYDHQETTGDREGYFDVYTIDPSGSGSTCLTCSDSPGASALAGLLNIGNPKWSPSGNFLVFQAQNGPTLGSIALDFPGFPGEGANCDIWATDTVGHFWRLTNQGGANGVGNGGVIYPAFSWDGTKLAWGQRVIPGDPPVNPGTWELAIGKWSEAGGIPSLTAPAYYQPYQSGGAPGYYEPHSFGLDNTTVFFMGDKETPGTNTYARNIYSYNPTSNTLVNLTNTVTDWNEYPLALPALYDTNKLVYMSYPKAGSGNPNCVSDLWLMNYDGTDKERLTFYNDPYSQNYVPKGVCLDTHSWNANASQLAVFSNNFAVNNHTGQPANIDAGYSARYHFGERGKLRIPPIGSGFNRQHLWGESGGPNDGRPQRGAAHQPEQHHGERHGCEGRGAPSLGVLCFGRPGQFRGSRRNQSGTGGVHGDQRGRHAVTRDCRHRPGIAGLLHHEPEWPGGGGRLRPGGPSQRPHHLRAGL